jgi:hypothetical protein
VVLQLNGAAHDTDNKLHNEKTSQPTKGQRYDRLTKRTFQTSRKEKIPWAEASSRLITPAI